MKDHFRDFSWPNLLQMIPAKQLVLTISYGVIRIGISLLWPYMLYRMVRNEEQWSAEQLSAGIVIVLVLFIISATVSIKQSAINLNILQEFSGNLTDSIWRKMAHLDWHTFHGKNRVYYYDMLMVEAWRLRGGVNALLDTLLVNSVIAGVLTLFVAFISFPLFILCLVGLLTTVVVQALSMKKARPYMKDFHDAWRHQHHWISKSVDQFDLIKLQRGYEESLNLHRSHTSAFLASNARMITNQSKWRNINQLIGNMVRVGILITGLYWVQINLVSLPELLLVFLIVTVIQGTLVHTSGALTGFMESQEAMKTIQAFFELEEEPLREPVEIESIDKISIKNLGFTFSEGTTLLQTDIQLEKGKIYLWKGKNGTGKSTAAHLLLGFLSPQKGHLEINDQEVQWDTLKGIRNRFSFLNQYSPVFMGTVKENVVFGKVEKKEAWTNVVDTWLSTLLPNGDNIGERTIGDRGEGLSGGEAKRIALIRELLHNSEIMILDEPLNHLDQYAIETLKREVARLKKNTIIIIISHQPGFEDIADEIKQF